MLAKMADKGSDEAIWLPYKYRLARCLTKRRLGDYQEAIADLDTLFEQLIAEQGKHTEGSKIHTKLQRIAINLLKERLTMQCIIGKYSTAE